MEYLLGVMILVFFGVSALVLACLDEEVKERKREISRIWTALYNEKYLKKRLRNQPCNHCNGTGKEKR